MLKYCLQRLLIAIPTLFLLVLISFALMHAAPGNPFDDASERAYPPKVLENLNAKYHLDEPLYKQFFIYLEGIIKLDFGPSFSYLDLTVTEIIAGAFPISFTYGLWAFLISTVLGVAAGIIAALRQNTWIDYTVMSFSMIGIAIPNFVAAPLLVLVFAVILGWLPAGGWNDGAFANLVLPVFILAAATMAQKARITRGSFLEVLNSNFVRTARAKGMPTFYILWRHALKPALMPVVSYLGPAFVAIVTGSVIIDMYFTTGGLGQHFVKAAFSRDYSLVMGVTIVFGSMTILVNLIVDIIYTYLDPRIRYN